MISLRFEGKSDILNALKAEERARGRIRPEFATDLFTTYIQAKLSAGHSKSAVSRKLQDLEQDLLHLFNSFAQARTTTGLDPSPLFPAPSTAIQTTAGPSVPAAPRARVAISGIRRSVTNRGEPIAFAAPARPVPIAPEDAPPPPYDRVDPEPEMTAQLAREVGRSAAEAGAGVPVYTSRAVTPESNSTAPDS